MFAAALASPSDFDFWVGEWEWSWQRSMDGGSTWETQWAISYRRKVAA